MGAQVADIDCGTLTLSSSLLPKAPMNSKSMLLRMLIIVLGATPCFAAAGQTLLQKSRQEKPDMTDAYCQVGDMCWPLEDIPNLRGLHGRLGVGSWRESQHTSARRKRSGVNS